MIGNVWEWCASSIAQVPTISWKDKYVYADGPAALRGGGYLDRLDRIHPFMNEWEIPNGRNVQHSDVGFRVAMRATLDNLPGRSRGDDPRLRHAGEGGQRPRSPNNGMIVVLCVDAASIQPTSCLGVSEELVRNAPWRRELLNQKRRYQPRARTEVLDGVLSRPEKFTRSGSPRRLGCAVPRRQATTSLGR
jgi:hypothetical protein